MKSGFGLMKVPFIDIHTHQSWADAETIRLVNCIIGKDYFRPVLCSAGIHPWHIDIDFGKQLDLLANLATKPNVLAIGECGLDKLCDTKWETQEIAFRAQVQLANQVQKPLIIHSVRAYQEIQYILKNAKNIVPVLFHGFSKNIELAKALIANGYYVSLGASLCNGKNDDLIKTIPLDRVFLETDNKSSKIVDIYLYFCAARAISMEELKWQIAQNFQVIFKYDLTE